jgi:asparaginyl-tRNA synthetase
MDIRELFYGTHLNQKVTICGWVRTFRANRFIALNDGSCLANLQCVVDFESTNEQKLSKITTGSALEITGVVVNSQGKGQKFEVQVDNFIILGASDPDAYPIQPKKHSLEFLREKAHLRVRTNTFSAVMRLRAALSFAVHHYFRENGFYQVHTPIITGSDAEGAGEMFRVTTKKTNQTSEELDFFGKETNLTVSGQLEAETYAMALGKVYSFGPTFRAENSNTSRHLSEFWMIEPEVAFNDLDDNMNLAEDFIKSVLSYVMKNCNEDLSFLDKRFTREEAQKPKLQRSTMGLLERLEFVIKNKFERISYNEAIDILKNSNPNKKKKFKYPIDDWGIDLQSEHERYLVEKHFNRPVIIFNYPSKIKAFYMRMNDDGNTVRAMDVLFPSVGEMVGGSQREERLEKLLTRMKEMDIDEKELWWYTDLRRFGTAIHSGFGLGFERLVLYTTGMSNIRDVIPYPRTPLSADF